MGILSSILKIGGTILGGPLGGLAAGVIGGAIDSKQQSKLQGQANAHNDPQAIRDRYEAAGFNPLLGISNANPNQQNVNYQPKFGSIINNAIAQYQGNNREKEALKIEQSRLDLQKQEIQQIVKRNKLNPKVAGIYGGSSNGSQGKTNSVGSSGSNNSGRNPTTTVDTDPILQPASVPVGFELSTDPKTAPTQAIEDLYGEPVSWAYGLIKLGKDIGYTYARPHAVKSGKWLKKQSTYKKPQYPVYEKLGRGKQSYAIRPNSHTYQQPQYR